MTVGRPPKYSRDQLQAAAIKLVDEHGLHQLTMRTLASALGTGAMTLYSHVSSRADLELLVVDAVLADAQLPAEANSAWQDEIQDVAVAIWEAIRRHPHAIPLILTRASRSTTTIDVMEALLRPLARSGLADDDLLVAFRTVTALVIGAAQAEVAGPLTAQAGETPQAIFGRLQSLPAADYPHVTMIARAAEHSDPEDELKRTIQIALRGLTVPHPAP